LAVALLVPLTDLAAQETPPVTAGDQVRIKAPSFYRPALIGTWIQGTVVSLSADTLVLKGRPKSRIDPDYALSMEDRLWTIPHASVTKFKMSRRPSMRRQGALFGLCTGLIVGGYVGGKKGAAEYDECAEYDFGCFWGSRGDHIWGGVYSSAFPLPFSASVSVQ